MSKTQSGDKGPLVDRLAKRIVHDVYTSWGRLGGFSRVLANGIELAGPPLLVLSLPRSGSSWLGSVLGNARDALYLREPVSERRRAAGEPYTLAEVDPQRPPGIVEEASNRAFTGIPSFPQGVIQKPQQWSLHKRHRGRLVIKEVNPLACDFWLQRYQPLIIYLVRHPAAVAASYRRLGWLDNIEFQVDPGDSSRTLWEKSGIYQGRAHERVLGCLRSYSSYRIVRYEDLCLDPVDNFRDLFEFAGLEWDDHARRAIERRSAGGDRRATYDTHRDSLHMMDSWRGELEASELEQLRSGYLQFDLPWYNNPQDW